MCKYFRWLLWYSLCSYFCNSKACKGKSPRPVKNFNRKSNYISGNEVYNFEDKFSTVGERNNVAGSKIFKNLIEEKNYIKALEIARSQIKNGG